MEENAKNTACAQDAAGGTLHGKNLGVFVVLVLAHLVSNTAGGFAGRLAGGLAFATAAGLYALGQVAGFESLNTVHRYVPFLYRLSIRRAAAERWNSNAALPKGKTACNTHRN